MDFSSTGIRLKNGEVVTIRNATLKDAAALIACRKQIIDKSGYMPYAKGEYQPELIQEQALIHSFLLDAHSLILVAMQEDKLIGCIELKAGDKRYIRHTANLSMGILLQWQGHGLGKALMALALKWAVEHPSLESVWLEVFANNKPAISLYAKLGFLVAGCKEQFIKMDNQQYADVLLMKIGV